MNRLSRIAGAAIAAGAVASAGLLGAPAASADYGTPGCAAPDYEHTVPAPAGIPSVSANGSGNGFIAMVGTDRRAYDFGMYAADYDVSVSPLFCEGGGIYDAPSLTVSDTANAVYGLGAGHVVYYRVSDESGQTGWLRVPGSNAGSGPVAIMSSASRTDVFYMSAGTPNGIYHHVLQNGVWSGPEKLGGGGIGRVSAYRLPNGKFRLWLTGTNHAIYYNTGNTGSWTGWKKVSTGGSNKAPAGTIGFDPVTNREDVFLVGTNGGLYEGTFSNNLQTFSGWRRVDALLPNTSDIAAAAVSPGRLLIVGKAGQESVYKQYIGYWDDYYLTPYACPDCAPTPSPALTAGKPTLGGAKAPYTGSKR